MKSHCAAVLTENFFMDNHSDLDFIQSQAGKQAIIDTHVEGITKRDDIILYIY
jgi:N-acetylmuramoyl-L-alanine amidase